MQSAVRHVVGDAQPFYGRTHPASGAGASRSLADLVTFHSNSIDSRVYPSPAAPGLCAEAHFIDILAHVGSFVRPSRHGRRDTNLCTRAIAVLAFRAHCSGFWMHWAGKGSEGTAINDPVTKTATVIVIHVDAIVLIRHVAPRGQSPSPVAAANDVRMFLEPRPESWQSSLHASRYARTTTGRQTIRIQSARN